MVGEKWAATVLKEALGLTAEDMEQVQAIVHELKTMGPALIKRLEASEARTLAVAIFLKKTNPELWKLAEEEARAWVKKKNEEVKAIALTKDS